MTGAWHLPPPEPWTAQAICQETDPEAFFPEPGGSVLAAKTVCANCPVSEECLAHALRNDEHFGVWGGTTQFERRKLRRQRREALRAAS